MQIPRPQRILFLIVLFFFSITQTSANYKNPELLADKIHSYIIQNYPLVDHFPVYNTVRNRLISKSSGLRVQNTGDIFFMKDLMFYNTYYLQKILKDITSRDGVERRYLYWKEQEILSMQTTARAIHKENTIKEGTIILDNRNQFTQDGEIWRVSGSTSMKIGKEKFEEISLYYPERVYYKIDEGYLYFEELELEKKIAFADIVTEPKKFLLYGDNFYEEDGVFYTYVYEEYFPVSSRYGVYKSDIEASGYSYQDAVFLRLQDAQNNMTFTPRARKIVSKEVFEVYNPSIQELVNQSSIDVLRSDREYQDTFKELILLTSSITAGDTTQEEKIQAIYDWMQQNITYPSVYDIQDYKIYSGLETLNTSSGVCEGQVRLMYYLLKLAGIEDVQIFYGYVINSPDFPKILHAWIQIGDKFYDPSFESEYQENPQNYKYFAIPYDIFYTDRFNIMDIPDEIFEFSHQELRELVGKNRFEILKRYPSASSFRILKKSYFKKKYNIPVGKAITLQDIFAYIPVKDLYFKDGQLVNATNLDTKQIEYFPIKSKDSDIEIYLESLNYNLENIVYLRIYNNGVLDSYGLK